MASATFHKEERKGAEALEKFKDAGAEAVDKAKEVGAETFAKVKEAGAQVLGKAKEAVGSVGDMAVETASAVGKKADDVTASAGHEIKEFGETIGKKGPHEGFAGQASQAVADTIMTSGKYIEDAKLSGMAHDVENVIKTHPIPSLLICLGIGFCIGRAMRD
jgi:hypothetical protein